MVDDLVLQVDSGHVLWVGHSYSQQDAHQQVDNLRRGMKREEHLKVIIITVCVVVRVTWSSSGNAIMRACSRTVQFPAPK